MARLDTGSVTVSTAGTRVQVTSSLSSSRVRATDKITSIEISPRSNNSGAAMYFGTGNVSSTMGRRILKGDSITVSLEGGDDFSQFYVDSDGNGDIADWTVIW